MNVFRFEWDEAKNIANQRKHGVNFEDASEVFADPLHVTIPERVVGGEQRWQAFGVVDGTLLLMVAHTVDELQDDETWAEVIRIISARPAVRRERQYYEDENG